MATPFDFTPIDPMTGMMNVGGRLVNYRDFQSLLDQAIQDHVDALKELRDPQSDTQNLWGRKSNRYVEDWYGGRCAPIRSQEGKYADEIGPKDWRP